MSIEQRIKMQLGEMVVSLLAAQVSIDEQAARIKELEAQLNALAQPSA